MLRSLCSVVLMCAALALGACHPGAVIDTDPKPSVGGTIAGVVRSGANPVVGRSVTAVNTGTNARFETKTGANGGYTIKVPEGTYRVDLEIRAGETIAKRPDQTTVNNSDLDSGRDFEITGP
jgi:carboxypeptidase family protein